jgi:hypothetical protein
MYNYSYREITKVTIKSHARRHVVIFRYLSIIPLGELTVTRFQLCYTLHRHEHETVLY